MTPIEAEIIDFYDRQAIDGALIKKDPNFWLEEFTWLTRNQPIFFDLGCGDGREVKLYQKTFGNLKDYFGLDFSSGMLSHIRSFAPEAKLVQANLNRLPFADNSLPSVWATASYLHIDREQMRNALAELFRVMAPGSRGFISLKANPKEQNDYNQELVIYYDFTEFGNYLKRVGFEVPCKFWDPVRDPRGVAWMGFFFIKP